MAALAASDWGGGSLASLRRDHGLSDHEVWVMLLLLHERLHSHEGTSGRRLLNALFDSSFEVLEGTALLLREGRLRQHGLVRPLRSNRQGKNALDRRFVLSDRVHRALLEDLDIQAPTESRPAAVEPYRSHFELLLDYRRLVQICSSRGRCVFETNSKEYRQRRRIGVEAWSQRVSKLEHRMSERMRLTENAATTFPILKLQQQFHLSPDELLVVAHLLFQELFEGNSFVEAVDVIKMTCRNESEMFLKQRLISERGTLLRAELVLLDDMVNDKQMTAEVCLNNWVVERLLAPETKEGSFSADARLDFHLFLERLDSSEEFYEELEREG
ncbi:MAG: hypothetical protein RL885_06460 [Planctomycetota bacterium]